MSCELFPGVAHQETVHLGGHYPKTTAKENLFATQITIGT